MYSAARGFPEKNPSESERKTVCSFMNSIVYLLPCESCRRHFKISLRKNPVYNHTNSSDELCKWVLDRRNEVAERIGKLPIAYKDAENYFFRYYLNNNTGSDAYIEEEISDKDISSITSCSLGTSSTPSKVNYCAMIILVIIIVILIVFIVRRKCNKECKTN